MKNNKLKITFVSHDFSNESIQSSGGASKSLYLIAKNLISNGHEIKIISIGEKDFKGYKNINGINFYIYSIKRSKYDPPLAQFSIFKILKAMFDLEGNTDIYHFYNVNYDYVSYFYKKISNNSKPLVSTLNNYSSICPHYSCMLFGKEHHAFSLKERVLGLWDSYRSTFLKKIFLLIYAAIFPIIYTQPSRSFDTYIALRQKIKKIYEENNFKNISIIPNIYEEQQETNKMLKKDKIILFVGRIKGSKGLEFLIKAFLQLKKNQYKLVVVGDGQDLPQIKKKFAMYENIIFIGHVLYNNVSQYYRKADIFVHPGQWPEPFARTIIEAISNQCRILVSDISAPEFLFENNNQNTFKFDNVKNLTNKIENLIDCPDKGYISPKALDQLKPDRVLTKLISLYRALIV